MKISFDIAEKHFCFCPIAAEMEGREELPEISAQLPEGVSGEITNNETVADDDAISWFRMKLGETANRATAGSQRKALNALLAFAGGEPVRFDSFTERFAIEWAAWLIQSGYTSKTAAFYMKQIATLYNKAVDEGVACQSEAIAEVRRRLLEIPERDFTAIDPDVFDKLQRFFRELDSAQAVRRLAADVVAFAILNGGMTFDQIARYKKGDYQGADPAILRIVERYARPRNSYLFPLSQPMRTPGQLRADLGKLFYIALSPYGIALSRREDDTAYDLWCMTALRCGVELTCLAGISGGRWPSFNPVLPMIESEKMDDEGAGAVREAVADALTANPLNWYAMQFRPHVDFARVAKAMEACRGEVEFAELFYPSEEIMRRTGGKLRKERRPVVPGLLFFRSRATDITPMFRNIGHLAWCYRQSGDRRSPYAVIPRWEMAEYQAVIGQFTPAMEVESAGTIEIGPNDRVVMIGGSFAGQPATVRDVKTTGEGRTICRLSFIGENMIEWEVKADSRQIKKISQELPVAERAS